MKVVITSSKYSS